MTKEEAVLADRIREALIDPKTRAHTMQPCEAFTIARHLLAAGYARADK